MSDNMSDKLPDPGTARYRMYKLAREADKNRKKRVYSDDDSYRAGHTPGLPE